jgi:hypothetical protein
MAINPNGISEEQIEALKANPEFLREIQSNTMLKIATALGRNNDVLKPLWVNLRERQAENDNVD